MHMDRRQFVKNLGLGTASLSMGSLVTASSCAPSGDSSLKQNVKEGEDGQFLFIGDDIAIAQTEYGKVQGYLLNHVYTFLGVPYGADTSGKNRFMPPQKPEPWTDVRPAVFYGNTAPQRMENRWPNNYGTFADHWNYWDVSEDCLYLNVWTPGIADGKKRPVLVWLHGGGFTNGSGIEQDGYHGENISREGDIVFCSINHRLGPIGFSDLSGVGGEAYKDSGNVGMLDIIAALRWVHDNIANFGGDPGNVTVMGQSGGGSKVCTVAAMPAAKGLIHRAVALSGSTVGASDQVMTRKIVKAFAKNFPDKTPMELWAMILSSRQRVVEAANAKLKQGQPVYVAWFGWCPPLFNNRMRAFHCSDICFWFKNTDRMFTHTGGGKVPRALSDKMSGALLNFMRTGDPNGGELPAWPKYTEENGEVMILNNTCEARNDPDREARKSLEV